MKREQGLNQYPKSGLMKYSFKTHCSSCQRNQATIFYIAPELPGQNFRLTCKCGNEKIIDDLEVMWIADTLKAQEITF